MFLARSSDYAVRALCFLSNNKGRTVSAKELVKETGIPYPFLRKLLQVLGKKKILVSRKGLNGGFELNRKASSIYLREIIEIFQGPFKVTECNLGKRVCPNRGYCKLKHKMDEVEEQVLKTLEGISIAGLCS
ncbi:MAG: Rrf2 family transcriptional regulator [Candidatus Firestonebacteria bacterium]